MRRSDRSVRIQPGSFTLDPGMRARDEFTDVGSAGYQGGRPSVSLRVVVRRSMRLLWRRRRLSRSAEQKREWAARILAAIMGGRAMGSGMQRFGSSPAIMGVLNPGIVGPVGPGQFMKYSPGGEKVQQVLGGLGGAFAAGIDPLADALERLKERKGWPPYDTRYPEFQGANWGRP